MSGAGPKCITNRSHNPPLATHLLPDLQSTKTREFFFKKSHNKYIFKRKTINPASTSLLFLLTVRHICRRTMSQCTERGREEGRKNRQTEIKTDEETRSQQMNSQQETHAMSRTRIKKQTKKEKGHPERALSCFVHNNSHPVDFPLLQLLII